MLLLVFSAISLHEVRVRGHTAFRLSVGIGLTHDDELNSAKTDKKNNKTEWQTINTTKYKRAGAIEPVSID